MVVPTAAFSWQNIWRSLLRHKVIVFCVVTACLITGLLVALLTPEKYESMATVLIQETDLLSGSQLRFVPNYPQREELEMLRRRISSHEFLVRLVDSLSIRKNPKLAALIQQTRYEHPGIDAQIIADQKYVEHLRRLISARLVSYNMIEIKASGPTAHEAYVLARAITKMAIAESKESQEQTISAASTFSTQQMEIYKKKLTDAENRLFAFNRGVVDAQLDQSELAPEKIQELEAVLLSNNIELQTKQSQFDEMSGILRRIPAERRREMERARADIKRQMLSRTKDLNQLLKKFTWRDVEIIQLNEQIAMLKDKYKEQTRSLLAGVFSSAESRQLEEAIRAEYLDLELQLIRENRSMLSTIIHEHQSSLREAPSKDVMRERLEREVRVNREIYDLMAQQLRGTQIRESAQISEAQLKYKVITPPMQPLERVRPIRSRIMMIAGVIGLVLSVAAVFGLETLDASIRRVEDVPKFLGVPVLATIPRITPPAKKNGKLRARLLKE